MADTELEDQENAEITLGTGKLLSIFLGLVLLCSLFFTMGYMLGRSNATGSKTEVVGSETGGSSPAGKPSAANRTPSPAPVAVVSDNDKSSKSSADAPAPPAQSASAPATLVPASVSSSSSSSPDAKAANAAVSYMVQVAAVSKREDADVLVSQLQKKQYPAFVGNNSGDALFHVLVGPLTDPKDAETMRSRLASDGYNAIVKNSR